MIAGGVLLYAGAEGLVRGAAGLALRAGLGPLAVGLTVVAFGTSAPELAVSVGAALGGAGDLAVGNVVGSNVCNVLLVLGLSALVRPLRVHAQLVRLDVPLVIAASAAAAAMLTNQLLGRGEGLVLLAGLVAWVGFGLREARREPRAELAEFGAAAPRPTRAAGLEVLLAVAGIAALAGGSELFVGGATELARVLGVSEALVGLTLVAVGTSLPEMATSVVATFRGQNDIAVGNVVGSNLFNLLGILGVASLVRPLATRGVDVVDLGAMLAAALVLLALVRARGGLDRARGALLLTGYAAWLGWLVST